LFAIQLVKFYTSTGAPCKPSERTSLNIEAASPGEGRFQAAQEVRGKDWQEPKIRHAKRRLKPSLAARQFIRYALIYWQIEQPAGEV
jgi:hypothetical protein